MRINAKLSSKPFIYIYVFTGQSVAINIGSIKCGLVITIIIIQLISLLYYKNTYKTI